MVTFLIREILRTICFIIIYKILRLTIAAIKGILFNNLIL